MAHLLTRPAVLRPLTFATEETQALHSWSRVSSAGQSVVLEALKILGPKLGTPFPSSPAQLSTRRPNSTQDLSSPRPMLAVGSGAEKVLGVGTRPRELPSTQELLIFLQELREEGHRATVLRSKDVYGYRSVLSCPLTQDKLRALEKNQRPAAKRRGRKPLARKREVHPSWRTAQRSSPRIQGTCPPEAPLGPPSAVSKTAGEAEPRAPQPCLRLTSLQGLPGAPTARLQIHTSWEPSSGPHIQQPLPPPPALSGIPLHPTQTNGEAPTSAAVALLRHRGLSCPVRHDGALIGDSAPVLYGPHTELSSNWAHGARGSHPQGSSSRRGLASLRRKVIKVDHSRSVADARRKAQKILQLNLSPVIHIQPLVIREYRHLQ